MQEANSSPQKSQLSRWLKSLWRKITGNQIATIAVPEGAQTPALTKAQEEPQTAPEIVVVGAHDQEVMSMRMLSEPQAALTHPGESRRLPESMIPKGLSALIEPLAQIAPSIATAAAANSKSLMEVVIKGELLQATDGNGLRAIAKAPKGFEHARLYEPQNLQKMANAAAIFQILSVAVAQKHLADISATLKRVENKVSDIQNFLESERSGTIHAIIQYIKKVKLEIENGEFNELSRHKLEDFDAELDKASFTLLEQIRRESRSELETDTAGCEGEYRSAKSKHTKIQKLISELVLCNETRLTAWYLCRVFPGGKHGLQAKLEQIKESRKDIDKIQSIIYESTIDDCAQITSALTRNSLIEERRADIKNINTENIKKLATSSNQATTIFELLEQLNQDKNRDHRIIVESTGNRPQALYVCQ